MELRDYQQKCITNIMRNVSKGIHYQYVVMATGLGKTCIFANLPQRFSKKTLILAHREELLQQAKDKLLMFNPDLKIEIEQANKYASVDSNVVIGSIQTLGRKNSERLKRFDPQDFDLIIIDEVHHAVADSYKRILEYFGCLKKKQTNPNNISVIGFTATPGRLDNKGMEELFDKVSFKMNILDGIKQNYLANIKAYTINTDTDISNVGTLGGDFIVHDLSEAVNTPKRNRIIAESYKNMCNGEKALVFSVDVQHANDLKTTFNSLGYKAEVVTGSTEQPERNRILEEFRTDSLNIVINCQVLTEGYDNEYIKNILLARPTKSTALFTQMVGRGTRLSNGKQYMNLLDFSDNISKHNIVTCSSLIGIDVPMIFNGQDIITIKDKTDQIINSTGKIEDLLMLDLSHIDERIKEVDIFNQAKVDPVVLKNSKYTWVRTPTGFSISLGTDRLGYKRTAKIDIDELNMYHLYILEQIANNVYAPKVQIYDEDLTDSDEGSAIKLADKFINNKFPYIYNLVGQKASWRKDPPTEKQIKYLQRLGYKNIDQLNKGQASMLLSKYFESLKKK